MIMNMVRNVKMYIMYFRCYNLKVAIGLFL